MKTAQPGTRISHGAPQMSAGETTLNSAHLAKCKLQRWIARFLHYQGAGFTDDVERANGTESRIIEARKVVVYRRERPELMQALHLCLRQWEQAWFFDRHSAEAVALAKPPGGKRRFGDDLVTGNPIRHLEFEESRVCCGPDAQESHGGASGIEIGKVLTRVHANTLRKMVLGQLH